MKYSIRKQFAFIFIGLMALMILVCWFINRTFLETYYFYNKQNVMMSAYEQLVEASEDGNISSTDFDNYLQQLSARYNISVLVLDADSETIRVSGGDPSVLRLELWNHVLFDYALEDGQENDDSGEDSAGWLFNREEEGQEEEQEQQEQEETGRLRTNRTIATSESPFYVLQLVTNDTIGTDYMDMWGFLENGNLFFIRTAMEGMRDSAEIASRFLLFVGSVVIALCAVIVWFVTKKITQPILKLADISDRMAHLDFDARYEGHSFNEIAVLGNHMNEMADTLEETISELKTANNELQKDIERKNEIDVMRQEFLSNVSHELKTPIALIQGYAEGLKEGINDDDQESRDFYCDVIIDEASKMNMMVKKLMTLNELEFGSDVVSLERFDLAALIDNYLQSADILIRQNEATVNFEKDGQVYVWGDEFKTEEVFMNYFSNALNHLEGERIIDVKLVQNGKNVRVSVFNTGQPIPEDSLPHIWEKFYKVDKARTREYGGSGVGLSIVKAIQDSINQGYGVVNYENGVEFWFELELVSSVVDA